MVAPGAVSMAGMTALGASAASTCSPLLGPATIEFQPVSVHVKSKRGHLQILQAVVRLVAVLVVDHVATWNRAIRLLPDIAMFQNPFAVSQRKSDVPVDVLMASTRPHRTVRSANTKGATVRTSGRVAYPTFTLLCEGDTGSHRLPADRARSHTLYIDHSPLSLTQDGEAS